MADRLSRTQPRNLAKRKKQSSLSPPEQHPLLTPRFGGAATLLVSFWGLGVALMATADSFSVFIVALTFAAGGIAASIWLFADEWQRLLIRHLFIGLPADFTIAATVTVVTVIGLCLITWQCWPLSAPLLLSARVGSGNYPDNEPMGQIKWRPAIYADLRVRLDNKTANDYGNVDIRIHSELPITEMTLESGTAVCSVLPAEDLSKMGHIGNMVVPQITLRLRGKDGKIYLAPLTQGAPWPTHLVAPDNDYRVDCDKLSNKDALVFLAAVVNPKGKQPRPPQWITVDTKYEAGGKARRRQGTFVCSMGPCIEGLSWWRKVLQFISRHV